MKPSNVLLLVICFVVVMFIFIFVRIVAYYLAWLTVIGIVAYILYLLIRKKDGTH